MPGTVLLGIDTESASEDSLAFATLGADMFRELGVPVTWYLTGQTLERYPEAFRKVDEPGLIDLQAHTYSHMLLKTVYVEPPAGINLHGEIGPHIIRGASPQEIDEDLGKCQRVFQDALGRRAIGLTGPWCYYRGLGDRPDLLEIVARHGFKVLRTFGRNERDGQPVPLEWKPFFYAPQGFPDILEIFIHEYQDDFYWKDFTQPREGDKYLDYLKKVADKVAKNDLTWSMASHDHTWADENRRAEKEEWLTGLIKYALGLNIRFLTVSQYYEEMLATRA